MTESASVQWLPDAAVPSGDCLVESGGTVVDASVSKRWERAVAALGLQSPGKRQNKRPIAMAIEPFFLGAFHE